MFRTGMSFVAALVIAGTITVASAETPSPAPTPAPTTSKLKLTRELLHELRVKWSANHAKLVACRKDVKAKGLAGDDRWFYIADCMEKS